MFSYAGRTANPVSQPLTTRVGGYGGVQGLAAYLQAEGITHVVDATHPFAAQMSRNAANACELADVPVCAFERPAWLAVEGDRWVHVESIEEAVEVLPSHPARVFLAIGKQNLNQFVAKAHHHYLLRLVDAPEAPLSLPNVSVEIARGPFDVAGDTALMQRHGITHVVAKNAGGAGAVAKLTAARSLGLPVIMIGRPPVPERPVMASVAEVMAWLSHLVD